jgi:hypothetical protein
MQKLVNDEKQGPPKLTFKILLNRYREHFKLLFTNYAANLIMIATFFRLLQTTFMNLYLQDYMKVYCDY